jgi:hypothetical protein
MRVLFLMIMVVASGLMGCASGSNSGSPGTEVQTTAGQGGSINPGTNFDQWRYQGITRTTP